MGLEQYEKVAVTAPGTPSLVSGAFTAVREKWSPVVADALDKLAALGSAQQIADYLLENNHAGRVGNSSSCPVAKYVQSVTGYPLVSVHSKHWVVGVGVGRVGVVADVGEMPEVVVEFVQGFDAGLYPKLISSSALADLFAAQSALYAQLVAKDVSE